MYFHTQKAPKWPNFKSDGSMKAPKQLLPFFSCILMICPNISARINSTLSISVHSLLLNGLDHHDNLLQRVWTSMELGPVDSVLVAASVMASSIPHPIQVRVRTHVVPPASFLVVCTITYEKKNSVMLLYAVMNSWKSWNFFTNMWPPGEFAMVDLCWYNSSTSGTPPPPLTTPPPPCLTLEMKFFQ